MATYQEIYSLLLQRGASPQQAQILAAIAMAESSGNAGATNLRAPGTWGAQDRGERSYGMWQINLNAHPDVTPQQAMDPNFAARWAISQNSYTPWSTFNNGAYKQYLETGATAMPTPDAILASPELKDSPNYDSPNSVPPGYVLWWNPQGGRYGEGAMELKPDPSYLSPDQQIQLRINQQNANTNYGHLGLDYAQLAEQIKMDQAKLDWAKQQYAQSSEQDRQKWTDQIVLQQQDLAEKKRQFDANFGLNQLDATEKVREFDATLGQRIAEGQALIANNQATLQEKQREFDISTGVDKQRLAADIANQKAQIGLQQQRLQNDMQIASLDASTRLQVANMETAASMSNATTAANASMANAQTAANASMHNAGLEAGWQGQRTAADYGATTRGQDIGWAGHLYDLAQQRGQFLTQTLGNDPVKQAMYVLGDTGGTTPLEAYMHQLNTQFALPTPPRVGAAAPLPAMQIPEIPHAAQGIRIPTVVGERGPELAFLSPGSEVRPMPLDRNSTYAEQDRMSRLMMPWDVMMAPMHMASGGTVGTVLGNRWDPSMGLPWPSGPTPRDGGALDPALATRYGVPMDPANARIYDPWAAAMARGNTSYAPTPPAVIARREFAAREANALKANPASPASPAPFDWAATASDPRYQSSAAGGYGQAPVFANQWSRGGGAGFLTAMTTPSPWHSSKKGGGGISPTPPPVAAPPPVTIQPVPPVMIRPEDVLLNRAPTSEADATQLRGTMAREIGNAFNPTGVGAQQFGGLAPMEPIYGQAIKTPEQMAADYYRLGLPAQQLVRSSWGVRDMPWDEAQRRMLASTPVAINSMQTGQGTVSPYRYGREAVGWG